MELVWSLARRLRVPRARVADVLDGLLGAAEIRIEAPEAVARSVEAYREGADFGDAMIAEAARSRGAELWTFDRRAARMEGVRLLEADAVLAGHALVGRRGRGRRATRARTRTGL